MRARRTSPEHEEVKPIDSFHEQGTLLLGLIGGLGIWGAVHYYESFAIKAQTQKTRRRQSMRTVVRVLAILLIAGGIVWILQGINVLPGSFMSGQIQWAYRGAIATVAGLVVLLITFRRKRTR
jgi:hypothetical protein